MKAGQWSIALEDAIRIKSAEFYVKLGNPSLALGELERVTRKARRHPWAARVFACAFQTSRYYQTL